MTEPTDAGFRPAQAPARPPKFAEFVALIGLLMGLNALAIDIMLPGLGVIGEAMHIASENDQQLIIVVYMLAFGPGQLIYGPMSDRYGRRATLLFALGLYALGSVLAVFASSFELLLASRALQGVGAAATRVVTVSVVRDLHEGRTMARVMSLAMMIFMVAPILAPAIGSVILYSAGWRVIFGALLLAGLASFFWVYLRLPETLAPENRAGGGLRPVLQNYGRVARQWKSMAYMAATGLVFGALIGFISASHQVFTQTYAVGPVIFPIVFAIPAAGLVFSNLTNAALVERLGMRLLSHRALVAFAAITTTHAICALLGFQPFWLFMIGISGAVFLIGFLGSNFTAIVMEPLSKVAGAGASMQGFMSTTIAAIAGGVTGGFYDGTAMPLAVGGAVCGLSALALIWGIEREHFLHPGPSAHPEHEHDNERAA